MLILCKIAEDGTRNRAGQTGSSGNTGGTTLYWWWYLLHARTKIHTIEISIEHAVFDWWWLVGCLRMKTITTDMRTQCGKTFTFTASMDGMDGCAVWDRLGNIIAFFAITQSIHRSCAAYSSRQPSIDIYQSKMCSYAHLYVTPRNTRVHL